MSGRILVTNVEERASLAACRALAAAGYTVIGAASYVSAAGLRSRACSHRLVVPDPRVDGPAFLQAVDEAYRRYRADAFLPAVDAALLALLEHPEKLALHDAPGAPRLGSLLTCLDKLALGEAATAAGLPPPATFRCETPDDVVANAEELGFPLLVKPRTSVVGRRGERRQQTGVTVRDEGQLTRALGVVGYPCLVQRFVEQSSVYSFGGVVADGTLLGSCFARYRRTWPPDVGSAAFAETLEPPPGFPARVLEIVTRLGWEGIFELEFVGPEGPAETIDFNPRLYGSLALSASAGANLSALWCDWLLGRDVVPVTAQPGFGYRWEEAELRFLLSRAARGRLAAAAGVLRPRRRTTHAVFQLGDPLPLLADALRVPVRVTAKTRRLLRRRQAPQPPVLVAKEPQ